MAEYKYPYINTTRYFVPPDNDTWTTHEQVVERVVKKLLHEMSLSYEWH